MKEAKWTHTTIRAAEPTIRLALRAGRKGRGKELGAVQCWPKSRPSMGEADRICQAIEAAAQEAGYSNILPDDERF